MRIRTTIVAESKLAVTAFAFIIVPGLLASAQDKALPTSELLLAPISTPDEVSSRLGKLKFTNGIPTAETAQALYDNLDHLRGVETFLTSFPGVSMYAIREGFRNAGVPDNSVLIFSGLMDAKSLFLTANCDTIYFWSYLNLSKGPLMVEVPPESLGIFDDMWFRWIGDFGLPGPDRGEGGRYLLLPPGYEGSVPDGGVYVYRSRTNGVAVIGRAFLENDDPKPVVDRVKKHMKIYTYSPGGQGTSIADFLQGKEKLGPLMTSKPAAFVEGTGKVMSTIPPNDASFYDLLDSLVQDEPASSLDAEIAGQFAAVGIKKGKSFNPDARMKKILGEAVIVGNATARAISTRARADEGFAFYGKDSAWSNPLFVGGYEFKTPPPLITKEGIKALPDTGARTLNARTSFFYLATVVTPAMCMNLTNIGSQYLGTFYDAKGDPFDGAQSYKIVLPKGIPAAKFWSLTLYDNQTRSMLDTPQRFPRAGSQSYPSPAAIAEADGSITIYFGPKKPAGVTDGNWIQTMPGKGWFILLRLYSPLEPFFDKSWRPSEIEEVN